MALEEMPLAQQRLKAAGDAMRTDVLHNLEACIRQTEARLAELKRRVRQVKERSPEQLYSTIGTHHVDNLAIGSLHACVQAHDTIAGLHLDHNAVRAVATEGSLS